MPNRGTLFFLCAGAPAARFPSSLALLRRAARAGMAMAFGALFRGRIGARSPWISSRKVAEAEAFSPRREASRLALLNRVTPWKRGSEESRPLDRPCTKRTDVQRWRHPRRRLTSASIRVSARRDAGDPFRLTLPWCADEHALPFRPAARRLPSKKSSLGAPVRPAAFCGAPRARGLGSDARRAGWAPAAEDQRGWGARAKPSVSAGWAPARRKRRAQRRA
jgi:hypothetical protein